MENYETINGELYQTADELIIAYNYNLKLFDYNYKHTIRTKYPEKVYGADFYLNIINFSHNQEFI